MRTRDFENEGELPMELQLDLLVDAELSEVQRKALLMSLDGEPGKWRDLAMRFLERQVERETVQELMAGGALVPVRELRDVRPMRRIFSYRMMGVAAGLLIAAVSAVVTVYVGRSVKVVEGVDTVAASGEFINADVPGKMLGLNYSMNVSVPIVSSPARRANGPLFAVDESGGEEGSARRSLIIQPDGSGNAVMIPVNTLPMKVY